jgi:glycosyltransferase involved in cell wall biosynthesis
MPGLSVVIPTRDRAARLRALLDSIEGADEIVVVADGATAEVEAVLAGRPVKVVRHAASRGPAAARNSGWRAAAGEWVAFVDDDCRAAPGWVAALRAAAAANTVVQGRVEPDPAEAAGIGPFARTLRVGAAGPFFQTANILYPRALLEALGGFDEAYAYPAGEDTDLGWRARESGAAIAFAPGALVWHAVHPMGPAALVRDARRWGSAVRIVKRHPGLRAHFHRRVFWKRSHERLLLAALGAVLARRTRGASLALAVPWALEHRAEHPDAAALARSLPAHLAVDGAELAAMARGSIEAGTLLL